MSLVNHQETASEINLEYEALETSRATIPIEWLTLPESLQQRFPAEYDPAIIKQLALSIQKGILIPHALVIKEIYDENGHIGSYELLQKPAIVAALNACGYTEIDAVIIHNNPEFDLDTATEDQLLDLGEQGALIDHIVRNVPLSEVISDDSIIDERYRDILVDELAAGQQVNTRYRPRRCNGAVIMDIIDGYHRTDSFKLMGAHWIFTRLSYGMTNEELADERVMAAARSAKAVKFARMIISMQQSYRESGLEEVLQHYDVKLSQIIGIAYNAGKTRNPGKNLRIPEKIVSQAIQWVTRKAILWNTDLGTLYQDILSTENSFIDIISQVRTAPGGGHVGDGVFNPVKFYAMTEPEHLAGDHDMQLLMVSLINERNLNTEEVRIVSQAMARIRDNQDLLDLLLNDPRDVEVLSEILGGEVTYSKGKMVLNIRPTQSPLPAGSKGPVAANSLPSHQIDDGVSTTQIIEAARDSTIFDPPPAESFDSPASDQADVFSREGNHRDSGYRGMDSSYTHTKTPAEYERLIIQLQEALNEVNLKQELGGDNDQAWYDKVATLSAIEREVVVEVLDKKSKGMEISQIDAVLRRKYNLTDIKLTQIKKSAIQRYVRYLNDLIEQAYHQLL